MAKTMRNEPCPCGSGKKYKACHGTTDQTRSGRGPARILAIVVVIVVIGGAAIAVNHFRTADLSEPKLVYDAENNRYWDPVHSHWHDGRPPAHGGAAAPAPAGLKPEPYEYNAETNHYWDPEHAHWHEGRPPSDHVFTAADGRTPEPYEYDAATDQHFDPGHGHWHEGMRPAQAAVPEIPGGTNVTQVSDEEAARMIESGQATQVGQEEAGIVTPGWKYDAENDRHWNPKTKTWEQGMPPLEAFPSGPN